jgi:recombination protein RecR
MEAEMLKILALEKLIQELSRLPGVGPKSAQRFAYYILKSPKLYSENFCRALVELKEQVHFCPQCYNYTDKELCFYCADQNRSDEILCVIEEPFDIFPIESSQAFRGRYHVLHGALSPLEGVRPRDLKITELFSRIEKLKELNRPIKEIIFAVDSDLEGDTTVLYLSQQLQIYNIKLSRIAQGIPIGSDIDYIDDKTISKALLHRVEV